MQPPDDDDGESSPPVTGADRAGSESEDENEWQFAVEDVGEDGGADDVADPEDGSDPDDGSVFGSVPPELEEIDPGEPDLENVLFVVLGVAVSVALMAALVGLL